MSEQTPLCDEKDQIGQQVAAAYRAGLADARRQIADWAHEEMQALPIVAHGKAELLRDLQGFISLRAEQTAAQASSPGERGSVEGGASS